MNPSGRAGAAIAVIVALVALGACSTPAEGDKKVASSLPADCPIGTHICRRSDAASRTQSVDAQTLRDEGVTTMSPAQPGPAILHGAGS
jgi:hypothetical protein